jgi:DNA invertase Pin-like site-specific DNA recombinase
VIYARFSSELQRDASIEDQVRLCRGMAEREGWQVVETFADFAMSGSSVLRPGYQALLTALRAGTVDVILSESLDRLSRDQEHVAALHKQARFAGARIVTLSEGEVSELHVGLKGTMGALYLKDLADKTRRGLEGRVREGKSGGGLCYGYRVVRGALDRRGEPERGLREIDPSQAQVIKRIFEGFAAGESPKAIAKALNAEGIAGPRGGIWQAGTIRGQAKRDTGLLRNRLYIGELVWNQRRWLKDPTGNGRVARPKPLDEVVVTPVPHLRIVQQELWDRVQRRLGEFRAAVEETETGTGAPPRFWEQRRAQHLLTGRVFCGGCGASFASVGRDYLACRTVQAGGACDNTRRVRRGRLEGQVLDALGSELMRPELVAAFVSEFTAEWNRLSAERAGQSCVRQRELEQVDRQLNGLIDAIADGFRAPGLQGRLDELSARQAVLRGEVERARQAERAPALHPNLSEVYRARVASLREALHREGSTEVREALRALVARVEVHADRVELLGELSALLRAGGWAQNDESPSAYGPEGLLEMCSVKRDAGTRNRRSLQIVVAI